MANKRFLALDVFRGMTICLMIIVNTPGDYHFTFSPLLHAKWHGFTPTDLVFPSFLFAVGNAISFVQKKWADKSNTQVVLSIFRRTAIIFLLGYLMYWFPFFKLDAYHNILSFPISETRILGVLQRIALCYGIGALLIYFCKPKTLIITSIILLLSYLIILLLFGSSADPLSLTGNAGLRFDLWLMGEKHLYHGEGIAFDPEGWLGTLPAIVNVLAGFMAGKYIQQKGDTYEGLSKLLLTGFLLFVVAYWWNFSFPINKKLWSSSFVLHTVGLDCMILAAIIYITTFLHKIKWTYFFEVFGKNPLPIYLLSELLVTVLHIIPVDAKTSLFSWIYVSLFGYAGHYYGSLLFAVAYMFVCWSVGYMLDKRKIYIRV